MNKDGQLIKKFNALGDPTRFALVKLLCGNGNLCVSELAENIGISVAGVSQQLKILEQSGFINRVRNGQKICYAINTETSENSKLLNFIEG